MDKISAPGKYDIPMDFYHSDCCAGHSVSGSGLVLIERKTLAHYWHASYLNPKREPIDSTALKFGRAAHAFILGEPEFNKEFVLSPYDDFRTKEARTWREQQSRTIVTAAQMDMIRAMGKTVLQTDLVKTAFTDGKAEQSLIWKDRETGLWLKSRPDWLPNTLRFVPNFKTTKNGNPRDWRMDAFKLGYHQGAALCLEGLKEVIGWGDATYYFVVQEKEPPYVVTPILMRDTDIEWGGLLNRSALRRLARAIDAGKWPGYSDEVVEVDMPGHIESGLQSRHEAGEFQSPEERQAA